MGNAQQRVEELTKQIQDLTKQRELAIEEARREKITELEEKRESLLAEINRLDNEWKELEKQKKEKDIAYNAKKNLLVEVESELEQLNMTG